jgi:hypothetical protein
MKIEGLTPSAKGAVLRRRVDGRVSDLSKAAKRVFDLGVVCPTGGGGHARKNGMNLGEGDQTERTPDSWS